MHVQQNVQQVRVRLCLWGGGGGGGGDVTSCQIFINMQWAAPDWARGSGAETSRDRSDSLRSIHEDGAPR